MSVPPIPLPGVEAVPRLAFEIERAEAVRHAAVPTVSFRVRAESNRPVRSLALSVQIRIDATRRAYGPAEQAGLLELFGEPARWGHTLRSLLWTNTSINVPPFTEAVTVDLAVPCTYDFEVGSAKYLDALGDGNVPLEFLFSGTMFFTGDGGGLQTARIPWDVEARFGMPVAVWRETIEQHFPGSAWLRLRKDVFDRLYAYKAARALPTWEAALDELLEERG